MNDLYFSARSAWLAATLGLGSLLGLSGAWAQGASTAIRQADFIVAVVNSEPITNQDVQVLRQRMTKEAAAQGQKPTVEELSRQALEQLINEKAQLQQARDSGIKIEEDAIDQAEMNVASSNQLTRDEFRKRLVQDGMSVASYREQLRHQLMIARVREREVEGRIRVSDLEVEQYLREQLQAQGAQGPVELNLAMILMAVPENSTEAQINVLAEKANVVARRARSGDSFAELAKAFSQASDRGANGGEMGLRPAERYPELFLSATRNLKVGMTSDVVRSGAGFHILKVIERRQGTATLMTTQTRARHILLRPTAQMSQAQAVARLNEVRQSILAGKADFAVLAKQMSQDGSAQQGGDLGWANPGMFVPEFEQVMNRLRPGQIGEPLVSRFGVHLIEVTDRRNAPMSDQDQRTMARNALREKKLEEAYVAWVEDVRGRAYVEMREPPQ
ncbi:molecular chaperone SurA [Limnohabitans sp. T6-5]|uniref:peptidylprolyl isomerase n=1 Tax=Limnohabitans sp. T6-5 TaxID=1100724 RepID=UPI000D34B636|nr:peptidylprolyl isomerase [Limnohabitans sp. T6-5]PUE06322.1 molecular chaperone SurA [Limnohabitans sp. T6-5]